MKRIPAVLLAAVLVLSAVSAFAGCKKSDLPPVLNVIDAPSGGIPADYNEDTTSPQEFAKLLNEMNALENAADDSTVRGVTNADGLIKVLTRSGDKKIRLHTGEALTAHIPAGDYTDRTLVLDAANASLESDASLGTVLVEAADALTLRGAVQTLAVYGENVTVTLASGADTVYVRGKNCTLRLTGGVYGKIVTVNQTAKVINETAAAVQVVLANGATASVGAGETLEF